MRKIILLSLIFILLSGMFVTAPVYGATDTQSVNQKDTVFISKVTPRTGATIVPPGKFPFYLEVEYSLISLPRAYVEVGVYIKSQEKGSKSVLVTKPHIQPVTTGKGALLVTTEIISIVPKRVNQELLIVASLKNNSGDELAYSSSINVVAGERQVIKSGSESNADFVQVLSCSPPEESTLPVGEMMSFVFKINYGVMSRPYAFVNFEFSDSSQVGTGMAWYVIVVPLEKGKGILKVTVPMTLPENLVGHRMSIGIPFRVDPLGGTSSFAVLRNFSFESRKKKN